MRRAVVFEADMEGYDIEQVAHQAITVGHLRALLEYVDDDVLFILSHDNGYTYGSIRDAHHATEQENGEWMRDW